MAWQEDHPDSFLLSLLCAVLEHMCFGLPVPGGISFFETSQVRYYFTPKGGYLVFTDHNGVLIKIDATILKELPSTAGFTAPFLGAMLGRNKRVERTDNDT